MNVINNARNLGKLAETKWPGQTKNVEADTGTGAGPGEQYRYSSKSALICYEEWVEAAFFSIRVQTPNYSYNQY